jgi:hypothetical protein
MQWLIKTYPADTRSIPPRKDWNWKLNQRILRALGIPSFTEKVVKVLAGQQLTQVIRACDNPTDSVKALLFAAGMGVIAEPGHPFKVLSSEELKLESLLELAQLRNQSSHGQSRFNKREISDISRESVIDNIEYAKNFTECFKDWI